MRILFLLCLTIFASTGLDASDVLVSGAAAPDFEAFDHRGKKVTLSQFKGSYVVLEWTSPKCQCVGLHYEGYMQKSQDDLMKTGVVWLLVNSTAKGRDGYLSERQVEEWLIEKKARPTAYLRDVDGLLGRKFGAKSTPHIFVVNPEGKLIFSGGPDNNVNASPALMKTATNYIKHAIEDSRAGVKVRVSSARTYGCPVKYADPTTVEAVGQQPD